MDELLAQFLIEGRELVQQASEDLLALEREGGWLVVDYKSGRPGLDESAEVFAERMRAQYRDQMQRYLDQLVALTRQPAQAALFFPRADLWLDMGAAHVPVSSGSAYNPGL